MIGAGAVVPPGMEIPAGMLAVGVPAKVRGPVEAPANAPRYQELALRYRAGLLPVPPAQRYQLTMKGQDALNPFSEVHMELKKHSPAAPAGPGGQPVGQPRARGHPDPPARGPGAGLPAKTPTEECGLAYSFASSGGYNASRMRPFLSSAARQPVMARALVLTGASSLVHVCEYLTASHPTARQTPTPATKARLPQAHSHLGDRALRVVHAIQLAPPAQVPEHSLFLLALFTLSASALVPGPVQLLPYSPRAPPRSI